MKIRTILSAATAIFLIAGASAADAKGESSGQKAQKKGQAQIPHCTHKIGTVAIVEPDDQWWRQYNLGSPEVVSLKGLAEQLVGVAGDARYELTPFPPDRKAIDIGDYYGDHALIGSELGWQPRVPLHAGLQRTLDYYRQYAARYWE